jgi:hypothetical protein
MEAAPVRNVLLYYPVYDLQREYIPAAEKMSRATQSELSKTIEISFRDLGANLLKAQNQFVLVDYLTLEKALVTDNKTIQIGWNQYSSLVFPRGVVLPSSVSALVEQAQNKGVPIVFADDFSETPSPGQLTGLVGSENKLAPSCPEIAFGKFTREGREIFILLNTGKENYHGELELAGSEQYIGLDPRTGTVSTPQKISGEKIGVELAPLQTMIFTAL